MVYPFALSIVQRRLVCESYTLIRGHEVGFAELFYHRLKQEHPFARALFPDDMTGQIEVFRTTMDTLVQQVGDIAALRPTLTALAQRHVTYGVLEQHYAWVGAALIETFAQMLGPQFTPEVKEAWVALYEVTAGVMIEEAYPSH